MVGTSSEPPALPRELRGKGLDVLQLLTSAGLVIKDELSGRPGEGHGYKCANRMHPPQPVGPAPSLAALPAGVSEGGFQFLLMDTYSQLWTLLREYISSAERTSSTELASVISFLLQLGLQGQQQCMQLKALGELEQTIASQVAQLGLLKPFLCGEPAGGGGSRIFLHRPTLSSDHGALRPGAGGEVWLCPTRLAAIMAGGQGGRAAAAEDGFIIIETNYRVYAYTTSPVQQSILRLFVRCEVLLPNLFVGSITRDSVTGALDSGIGAEQIIAYFRQHAHPRVAGNVPIVPSVVSDQIRLWQRELQRLTRAKGVMYSNFETPALYRKTLDFARSVGADLLHDDAERWLVGRTEAHDQLKAEIRRLKQLLPS